MYPIFVLNQMKSPTLAILFQVIELGLVYISNILMVLDLFPGITKK